MKWLEETLHVDEDEPLVDIAARLAEKKLLVAATAAGHALTIETIAKLALTGYMWRADLSFTADELPVYSSRMGKAAVFTSYLRSGQKYCLVKSRKLGVLTPRLAYSLSRDSLSLFRVSRIASRMVPAIVAPNATLKGALRRMRRRKSICAFVMRSGRLKGILDLWTLLDTLAERGEKMMEASCSDYASDAQTVRN